MKNLLDRHLKKLGARRPVSSAPGLKTTLSARKVLSLRGQSILPNLDKNVEWLFYCTFSYPYLLIHREFLICAMHCRPFVHIGFYHCLLSLIASIRVDGVKDTLELDKTASLLPRLLSSFMHLSTLKYLNHAILLMPIR